MEYKLLADPTLQPTLVEMTSKALEILKKNENGFVLLVEGGRIDTAHHDTRAQLALDETVEFHKTVDFVRQNTNEDDTLIVVTSDHSNVLTVGGYMVNFFDHSVSLNFVLLPISRVVSIFSDPVTFHALITCGFTR